MKNHANEFLWSFLTDWQNLTLADFAKGRTVFEKNHWHDFSCINAALFDFLRWNFFWPKIWPSLAKFGPIFGAKFFLLSRQEGICQYELNPKVCHFYLRQFKSYSTMCFQTIQGQCLFDLAAFKITNWSKRASNHIVWVPSIIFNLSLTLLDESGPYSSFEDRQYCTLGWRKVSFIPWKSFRPLPPL